MNKVDIVEIKSNESDSYKKFIAVGFIYDEESFRITANDELNSLFPTKDEPDSFTLGAFVENELAGVVSFERDGATREKLRHKGVLFRMYVSKKFRGFGIAKQLIYELIIRVKNIKDLEQINLTVIASNANAKNLYEKFGFEVFSIEENAIKWNGKYYTELQMVLWLK